MNNIDYCHHDSKTFDKEKYFELKNVPDIIHIKIKEPLDYKKALSNTKYCMKVTEYIKLSELIQFILETPIDDPVIFKSKLIKKVRGILNEN